MKTSGICGKQSARKHRQRGDYVIHTRGAPGRYTWLHVRTLHGDELRSAAQVRQEQRGLGITGKRLTGVILDDIWDEPNHMIVRTERGIVTIAQGSSYWPKRRNQHSKPYHVVGFDRGFVQHVRNSPYNSDDDEIVYSTPGDFVQLIGKPV